MKLRPALLATAAALVGAAGTAVLAPAPVDAAPTGDVIGAWTLRLKMDGWSATAAAADSVVETPRYSPGRGVATALMKIAPRDATVNDGLVTVEITLDAGSAGSVLALATPGSPNFTAVTAFVGDSLTAIDSGTPNYVNAVNLRFDRHRRKVSGVWFAAFPPGEAKLETQKFAAGTAASVTGKRSRRLGTLQSRAAPR